MTDQSPQARIRQLEIENGRLHQEISVLRSALGDHVYLPAEWRLTHSQRRVMQVLISQDVATLKSIMAALYSDRIAPAGADIVKVLINRMRPKLGPFGIEIRTLKNVGYVLDDATRQKFKRKDAA